MAAEKANRQTLAKGRDSWIALAASLALHLLLLAAIVGGLLGGSAPPELQQPITTRVTLRVPVSLPAQRPAAPSQPRQLEIARLDIDHQSPPMIAERPPEPLQLPEERVERLETQAPDPEIELLELDNDEVPEIIPMVATRAEVDLDGDFDEAPQSRQRIQPVYPYDARQRGESGSVGALVRVSSKGEVEGVDLVESSGYEALDKAARSALLKARFNPARRGRIAVPARVRITIVFRLTDR